MNTPFVYGKIVEGGHFINREKETEQLRLNLQNGINTIIISPRRWGKSSLVNHAAELVQQENAVYNFCFIDLFNVRSEEDFYQKFSTSLLKSTSAKWEEWIENGKQFFRSLIPRFNVGTDPVHDFQVTFDWKELKKTPDEILDLPEKISVEKKKRMIICIDEFQNIGQYEHTLEFQKKLRSHWQKQQLTTYCLYGSKRHMLTDIFENKSMPFYKFGEIFILDKISDQHWIDYIMRQFSMTGKSISKELATIIPALMENHPYFVQLFANHVWQKSDDICTLGAVEAALQDLLIQNTLLFQREIDNLTNKQINFLKAVANGTTQFTARETLSTYDLGVQGNVQRIRKSLENREIIDLWGKNTDFIDPLFKIWFIETFLNKKPSIKIDQ